MPSPQAPPGMPTAFQVGAPLRRTIRWDQLVMAVVSVVVLTGATTVALRPAYMRWGATDAEVAAPLPGDAAIRAGAVVSTRAVTIHAPASAVWPWIVQLGQGRGGFYSHDWLENLFAADIHNADRLLPAHQRVGPGDHLSLMKDGPYGVVTAVVPGRCLVVEGWTWYLAPIDARTTRLLVRYPYVAGPSPLATAYYYGLFEQAHMVMELGMMLGIKRRAEEGTEAVP